MMDAIQRGMKLVVVDPRSSPMPARASGCRSVRVGPVVHARADPHVLYEVKTLDVDFLTNRTNGVYLIGADGGYLRNAAGKPQVFDTKSKRAVAFDAPSIAPLLEGEVDTRLQVKTGFTLMKEAMKPYTPEWAEKQSTVPAATIRRIAQEFVAHAHIGETITLNGVTMRSGRCRCW